MTDQIWAQILAAIRFSQYFDVAALNIDPRWLQAGVMAVILIDLVQHRIRAIVVVLVYLQLIDVAYLVIYVGVYDVISMFWRWSTTSVDLNKGSKNLMTNLLNQLQISNRQMNDILKNLAQLNNSNRGA